MGSGNEQNHSEIKLIRTGGIVVNDSADVAERFWYDWQILDDSGLVYAREPGRIFKLSLETGTLEFISSRGRGPDEMMHPMQITVKNDKEFYAYDATQGNIAHFVNEEIAEKIPGYLSHEVWTRSSLGYFWNDHIIVGIEDYVNTGTMNFDKAQPLAFLNVKDNRLTKHGIMSPTLLPTENNYPYIYLDEDSEIVFYVFQTDYSVMAYDIAKDSAYVASSYKAEQMRVRLEPAPSELGQVPPSTESRREAGLQVTALNGLNRINDQLIVTWFNYTEAYYEEEYNPLKLDVYGVIYDLPNLDNPREFDLPGRFLGTYNNYILVEENDDPLEYTIGYYKVTNN